MEHMFVLQFLEGPVLAMAKGYLVSLKVGEILDKLIKHVRPLDASLHKRLIYLKKEKRESIGAFLISFNQVVTPIKFNDARVRKILVEALLSN